MSADSVHVAVEVPVETMAPPTGFVGWTSGTVQMVVVTPPKVSV